MQINCYATVCAADGAPSATSRSICCRASLLVSYRSLAHVRFREETERVDAPGTAPSRAKLRAMDFAGLAKSHSLVELASRADPRRALSGDA